MSAITIVSDSKTYLVMSLQEKLQEAKFEVDSITSTKLANGKYSKQVDAYVLYIDNTLLDNLSALEKIKTRLLQMNEKFYVIGNSDELATIEPYIPKHLVTKQYVRPININDLIDEFKIIFNEDEVEEEKKILVVDDSGAMLRNVKGWLDGKYNVSLASSGTMAIKYLSIHRPDLILLDYEMPVCDGRQVLEMIRSEEEFKDIPVIFLTSKGDEESVMKVLELRPQGYLLKTMEPAYIMQAIDDFFKKNK